MAYYRDLREYIDVLEKNGRLFRIKREINKDTEMHPLVRWQFRGLPDRDRKAFLFERSIDVRGKRYASPVLIGAHAASKEIYAYAMQCRPEEIAAKWEEAQRRPIKPKLVTSGVVQEEIHKGDNLMEHGGLEEFPIPISTPGFDNAPYLSAGNWVSKDPDTGLYNIGNYRGMVKHPLRVGCDSLYPQHLRMHREKWKQKGCAAMPVAVVIGPTPNVGLVAVTKFGSTVDEYDVAGGIAGEPIAVVKCQTVDLEVPANAEIIIEGEMPCGELEREAPFGEYTGYIGKHKISPFLNVTCITHRKNPIWNAFLSQFPPSESSLLVKLGQENAYYKFLKYDLGLTNLVEVSFHNESSGRQFLVISLDHPTQLEAWKALNGAAAFSPTQAKFTVVVDEDIDPKDPDALLWAMTFRVRPELDVRVSPERSPGLDPSVATVLESEVSARRPSGGSGLQINATRKGDYPPVSLPRKEFMERARQIWEEECLPPLTPKAPWFGYSLGAWTQENSEEAELALQGEHYQTGEKLARDRRKG